MKPIFAFLSDHPRIFLGLVIVCIGLGSSLNTTIDESLTPSVESQVSRPTPNPTKQEPAIKVKNDIVETPTTPTLPEVKQEPVQVVQEQTIVQNSVVLPATDVVTSYACNCAKVCDDLSCDEAQYQLNTCGCSRRDADNDGVACDKKCQ